MVDIKSLMKPKTILRHFLGCRSYFLRPMINFVELYYGGNPVVGAEVGIYNGNNTRKTLKYFNYLKKIYLFDPYLSYNTYNQKQLNVAKTAAWKKLSKYEKRIIWNFKPFESSLIPEKIDFIYIDGNHSYDAVINDIVEAEKVVKYKGIIGGHDYYPENHKLNKKYGVGTAVREYFSDKPIFHKEIEQNPINIDWWVINAW